MGRSKWSLWSLAAMLVLASGPSSYAASLLLPIEKPANVSVDKTFAPAVNLLYQGKPIDRDKAIDLKRKGIDISTLDPKPNDVWNGQPLPIVDPKVTAQYPSEGATVDFVSFSGSASRTDTFSLRARVEGSGREAGRPYFMTLNFLSHRSLITYAALRKMGYAIPTPMQYRSLKIRFRSVVARDTFLDAIKEAVGSDPKRWIESLPENLPEVTIHDAVLEPARVQVGAYHWGNFTAESLRGQRELRGLLMPLSWLEVPETVNLYSWEALKNQHNNIVLTHPIADRFQETTYDDIKWAARKFAKLTREDLAQIIAFGNYPSDVAAIVLEKAVARRNQIVQTLGLAQELPQNLKQLPYSPDLTVGSVVNGKLTRESYDGHSERFAYGDPTNEPLRFDELSTLFPLELLATGMANLAAQINEHLVVRALDTALTQYQQKAFEDFLTHIVNNPDVPYEQPVETWGGPIANFQVDFTRHVTSGTYYGSESPIQLVDNIGVRGTLGYFLGIAGIEKLTPGLSGNLTVARNYVHVKPLASIKGAQGVPLNDMAIPRLISKLGKVLASAKAPKATGDTTIDDEQKRQEQAKKELEELLGEIKEGEIFTITDTLAAGAQAQALVPISALMPSGPVLFNQNITFGAQTSGVVLQRTTFSRTKTGIQVYVNNMNTAGAGLSFDFNWWINILRLSGAKKIGVSKTKMFDLPKAPDAGREALDQAIALRALFKSNRTNLLNEKFGHYLMDHELKNTTLRGKFLFFQTLDLEESHILRIQPPKKPTDTFNPKDYERTLFSHRHLKRTGKNYFGFVSDIIGSATKGEATVSEPGGDNPAYSLFGNARWSSVTTEVELTAGKKHVPVVVSEQYWAGWKLKKDKLLRILDRINRTVAPVAGMPIFRKDVFNDTKSVQLYQIQSTLIFYNTAIEKLKTLLFPVNAPQPKPNFIQKAGGWDKFSSTDKAVYEQLKAWMGESAFNYACYTMSQAGRDGGGNTEVTRYGNNYPCLPDWMGQVLRMRRLYKAAPNEVPGANASSPMLNEAASEEIRRSQIQWTNQLFEILEQNVELYTLLNHFGKDGYFFSARISGFREGNEDADIDESDYYTDTIGTFDQYSGSGIFRDLIRDTGITPHEFYARSFSEGN